MTRRLLILFVGLLVILLAVAVGSALVRTATGQQMIYEYVLPAGERHEGDLAVAARHVILQEGSRVQGDVAILAIGTVDLQGHVEGALSVMAPLSEVRFGPGFAVQGDLTICARQVARLAEVPVGGRLSTGCDALASALRGDLGGLSAAFPFMPLPLLNRFSGNPGESLLRFAVTACAVAALAALFALVMPDRLRRVTTTALSRPRTAGILGFLSMGGSILLTVAFVLASVASGGGLCFGLPLVALAWLILTAMLICGWIAVSYPLGVRLLRSRSRYSSDGVPPLAAAALGALVLTVVQGLLEAIPCLGWLGSLVLIILGSVGLGALILTRLGSRPYPEYIRHEGRL